jgi:hypothetical protein
VSNYTQITFFAPKDALLSGNPAKLIKGADVDPELAAIAVAIASKYDATNFAFANPTANVGLAAVNGSATTPMRSDAAPALSQAIAPTWTGNHIFRTASATGTEGIKLDNSAGDARFGLYSAGTEYGLIQAATNLLAILAVGASTALNLDTNNAVRVAINSAGNVTVNAPNSGTALAVTGIANQYAGVFTGGGAAGTQKGLSAITTTQNAADRIFNVNNSFSNLFDIFGDGHGDLGPNLSWTLGGAWAIGTPSSGVALTLSGVAGANSLVVVAPNTASSSYGLAIQAGTNSTDRGLIVSSATGSAQLVVRGDGIVQAIDQGGTLQDVGWRDIPQVLQNSSASFALSDRGKAWYTTTSAVTYTIPANASVAFPIGTTIVVINDSGGNIFLAITTDTLAWLQGGSTAGGTRTIAAGSVVTIQKVAATRWALSGNGIS